MTKEDAKVKRWRFPKMTRWSLRSFILFLTLFCAFSAWIAAIKNQAVREERVFRQLRSDFRQCDVMSYCDRPGTTILNHILPRIVRDQLGESFFSTAESVRLLDVDDACLEHLAQLPYVTQLELYLTFCEPTSHDAPCVTNNGLLSLAKMPKLSGLIIEESERSLSGDRLTIICRLRRLRNLQIVVNNAGESLGQIAYMSQLEEIDIGMVNENNSEFLRLPPSTQVVYLEVETLSSNTINILATLPRLRYVSLQCREISDSCYRAMGKLQDVNLVLPRFSEKNEYARQLKSLPHLTRVEFANSKTHWD